MKRATRKWNGSKRVLRSFSSYSRFLKLPFLLNNTMNENKFFVSITVDGSNKNWQCSPSFSSRRWTRTGGTWRHQQVLTICVVLCRVALARQGMFAWLTTLRHPIKNRIVKEDSGVTFFLWGVQRIRSYFLFFFLSCRASETSISEPAQTSLV